MFGNRAIGGSIEEYGTSVAGNRAQRELQEYCSSVAGNRAIGGNSNM